MLVNDATRSMMWQAPPEQLVIVFESLVKINPRINAVEFWEQATQRYKAECRFTLLTLDFKLWFRKLCSCYIQGANIIQKRIQFPIKLRKEMISFYLNKSNDGELKLNNFNGKF